MAKIKTLELEIVLGALTEVPTDCWEQHKRGKNWLATLSLNPRKPDGVERKFQEYAKGASFFYFVKGLTIGSVIEFGADYYTYTDNKYKTRKYFVIDNILEDKLILKYIDCDSQQAAFQLAKQSTSAKENLLVQLEKEKQAIASRLAEIELQLKEVSNENTEGQN